jgi:hypothetical protein
MQVVGEVVHADLEISPAVPVDIAFHPHVGRVLHEMQFACFVMELLDADEREVLVATSCRIGV